MLYMILFVLICTEASPVLSLWVFISSLSLSQDQVNTPHIYTLASLSL